MSASELIQLDVEGGSPGDVKGELSSTGQAEIPTVNLAGREPVCLDVLGLEVGALQEQVARVKYLFFG